jgi:hypothetical protein
MDKRTERLIELIKKSKELRSDKYFIFAVPQFLSKRFVTYCSIREDLLLINSYIERLQDKNDGVITSSLTYSLISLYGKCFTDASKNKAPKLEATDLFKDRQDLISTHEYLMDLRHNFIAHRGETASEVGIANIYLPKGEGKIEVGFRQLKQLSIETERLQEISKLINFMIQVVETKIDKTGQKVHEAYFELFTPEQMTLMLLNNATE